MMSEEQLQNIKLHLLKQLDNFPEDQRKIVKHKILSMNNQEMEEFLKENELNYDKEVVSQEQQCVFCAIVQGKLKSYKVAEDEDYFAILELNPLSRGHVLILPKKHVAMDSLSDKSIEFAKKVATIIFEKLSPRDVQFQKNEVLGHAALEVIPVYNNEKQEKKRASDEELISLLKELVENGQKKKVIETSIEEKKESIKLEAEKVPEKVLQEKKPELPKIKPRTGWL